MNPSTKLTQKYQATIPREVRELLDLSTGDRVEFEIVDGGKQVIIRKYQATEDEQYARALQETLTEWASKEDEEAYDSL